ncbi:hypothetical protein RFI_29092 [Reticulomyxa filosa]|uniref:EF-hand domain-containing protein n=1 Tax=Reticulomyxa filosa TaxID=46433 RepID=X6M2A3_RETFI|nr:hypothetical protein RFI_29092 [Reticulomyxa filosa]|eukprot:ETO08298.1 hypothetical protein RFI_29092 [Reticulomyxa filosa]
MLFGYPPFFADEDDIVRFGAEHIIEEKIRKGFCKEVKPGFGSWIDFLARPTKYKKRFPEDIPVSENCMKILSHMLESDAAKRWTVKECLSSAWIRGECHDTDISPMHKQALLEFNKTSKFKIAIGNYFAKYLEPDEVEDLKTFFSSLDENNDGVISFEEFKNGMKQRDKKLTEAQIETMFQNIDIDDSRSLSSFFLLDCLFYLSALHVSRNRTIAASRQLIAQDERLFRAFLDLDKDSSGALSKQELQDAMERLNPSYKDVTFKRQISAAFASADQNKDGVNHMYVLHTLRITQIPFFGRVLHPQFEKNQRLNEFVNGSEMYYAGANFDVVGRPSNDRTREVSLLVPSSAKQQFVHRMANSQHFTIDLNTAKEVRFLYNGKEVTLTTEMVLQVLQKQKK